MATKLYIAFHAKRQAWVVTYDGQIVGDDRGFSTWEQAWDAACDRVARSGGALVLDSGAAIRTI